MILELAPSRRRVTQVEECITPAFLDQAPLECFSPASLEFLGALSARLLAEGPGTRTPEAVALAYWLRPANLRRIAADHPAAAGAVRVPRGVALHVTPANVDTMFLYSFGLSLLAGNVNVVRVSQRLAEPLAPLTIALREVMQEPAAHEIAARNRYLT
jgi:hypothetical protein